MRYNETLLDLILCTIIVACAIVFVCVAVPYVWMILKINRGIDWLSAIPERGRR